jgi:hypothetical protein
VRSALLILLLAAPAWAWTSVEAPPRTSLEWVAQDMVYNGIPTRIQFFRSRAALPEVLAWYRQRWTEGGRPRYVENNTGPWKTISHAVGQDFVTIQVRPASGGGAEGYVSQRPIEAPPHAALGQGFTLPQGSEVVNDIQSRDGGQQSRTLLVFNNLTPTANASFFQASLAREGWALVSEGQGRDGKSRQMVLRHGNDELSLAMTGSGRKTAVGATLVRR